MVLTEEIPAVSIIMPVYNTDEYLEGTLNSALGQTLKNNDKIGKNIACIN